MRTNISLTAIAAISLIAWSLFDTAPARATLILKYAFDEGSGSTAADSSGFGTAADGTLEGTTTWSADAPRTGSSLDLPGAAGDTVRATGPIGKLSGLTNITFALWYNLQSAPANGDRLLSNKTGSSGIDWVLVTPTSGSIATTNYRAQVSLEGAIVGTSDDITKDGWVFLAVTYDSVLNETKFFLGTDRSAVVQHGTTIVPGSKPAALGAGADLVVANTDLTTADRTPDALFDDVQIHDTTLSAAELENLRGLPAQVGLLMEYDFDAGGGITAADSSGVSPAADLTLEGAATWSSDTPVESGAALDLSGAAADQATTAAGTVSKFGGTPELTLAFWVKFRTAPASGDRLLSNQASDGSGFEWLVVSPESGSIATNNYRLRLNMNGATVSTSLDLTTNGWVFLAVTYNDTQSAVQCYIGTTRSSLSQFYTGSTTAGLVGIGDSLLVGNTGLTEADRTPDALFDKVQIYDTELTMSELDAVRLTSVRLPYATMIIR